jgi:Zn-dependent M28 family amino/carboxypeptidase
MITRPLAAFVVALTLAGQPGTPPAIDPGTLLNDLNVLAADDMEGRRAGTPGSARARAFIVRRFQEAGIQPLGGSYERPFTFRTPKEAGDQTGVNVVGVIKGKHDGPWMVVTAHYDHLGVRNGQVFNGADDNASGVAALLAVAASFSREPPLHPILFAALDAEELGLRGARALLADPPIPAASIALNVNLDMVARDDANKLFAVGTHHYPFLRKYLENAAVAPAVLLFGHDRPEDKPDDWTQDSDHYAFHQAGIPFVYFGVEDEAQHHKPTDDAETVTKEFFVAAVRTIEAAMRRFDQGLAEIKEKR